MVIGPGSIVELIDDRPLPDGRACFLTLGAQYEVERVWDYLPYAGTDDKWMECSIDLVGRPGPGVGLAWGLYRFRLIGGDPIVARKVERELA